MVQAKDIAGIDEVALIARANGQERMHLIYLGPLQRKLLKTVWIQILALALTTCVQMP